NAIKVNAHKLKLKNLDNEKQNILPNKRQALANFDENKDYLFNDLKIEQNRAKSYKTSNFNDQKTSNSNNISHSQNTSSPIIISLTDKLSNTYDIKENVSYNSENSQNTSDIINFNSLEVSYNDDKNNVLMLSLTDDISEYQTLDSLKSIFISEKQSIFIGYIYE
ncbi:unnamed protein product, partial [Gordionus sp. m RMFG-2023]